MSNFRWGEFSALQGPCTGTGYYIGPVPGRASIALARTEQKGVVQHVAAYFVNEQEARNFFNWLDAVTKTLQAPDDNNNVTVEFPARFRRGDYVEWDSCTRGHTITRKARVMHVVPAGQAPRGLPKWSIIRERYRLKFDPGLIKRGETYLVGIPGVGLGKPQLFRPKVSALRRINPKLIK